MAYARRFNPYACFPCETRQASCNCCDFGGDTATFIFDVFGCEGFEGTQRITSTRTCDAGDLPAGVSYPSPAPCCVWPFTLGTGDGCESGGVNWGGSVYVVVYCTGDGYNADVYCFNSDTNLWVLQGTVYDLPFRCIKGCETFVVGGETVTVCCTWTVAITLPELDCCCSEPPPEDCCPCTDGDGRIIEVNFNSVSGCSLTGQTVMNSAATGCTFTLDGLNDGDCQISGGGSIECLPGGGFTLGATTNDGVVTPGTETDWSTGMTLTVNSCDPLDLEWTGPQGTVTAVEVP